VNGSRYAIETEDLSKSYGDHAAIHDLSLRVPEASVYGLIGPKGAGKTTTLRTLATLERVDGGTARVAGIDIRSDPSAVRERVAYMSQPFGFYGDLTVDEYLDFYGQAYGVPAPARRSLLNGLAELMDLTESRDCLVDQLPQSMKQRLSLARCLLHDPDVLLLDEPLRDVDETTRYELVQVMSELARLGKTILLTAEDTFDIADICGHVGMMKQGELVQEGPGSTLIAPHAGTSRLQVRILNPEQLERAALMLRETPACSNIVPAGVRTITADFRGTERDLSVLVSRMAAAGVSVTGFALENGSGEDADAHPGIAGGSG
jgi:ABC-2 type transport system ATP-binding protein